MAPFDPWIRWCLTVNVSTTNVIPITQFPVQLLAMFITNTRIYHEQLCSTHLTAFTEDCKFFPLKSINKEFRAAVRHVNVMLLVFLHYVKKAFVSAMAVLDLLRGFYA